MQSNKLRMAIRATAAAAVLGVSAQAGAISFETGGYETSIYGYARFNASYDFDNDNSLSTRSGSYANLANDSGVDGHFGADAVQSRIGILTTTPQGVKINVEGDFRGAGNTIRLRHAYGEYNGVLMGQTWSNFTSFVGNTSTLDFDSLPGAAGLQSRSAQVRYTSGPLSLSLEQPSGDYFENVGGAGPNQVLNSASSKDSFPAVTARLQDSAGGLSYAAAVLAHQVEYDTGATDDSFIGFATFGSLKMALTDMITIQGSLTYTDGANSYLYRSGDNFGAASAYSNPANADLESVSGYGGQVGAGINLGGGRSINIGYGMVEVDWDDAESDGVVNIGGQSENNSAIMTNYQWTPIENVMMGVEYQFLKRENVDGSDGDGSRILFAGQYNF
ncbi:MAG: DcaP family trimeric outer membrane transporter [Marinobacter sp.]|uniref:DcaP family trimeric outer membrane transporter n=1 Tax=Marinobacter sp. TaxID=50741 RepID=UPI00349FD75F